MTWYEQMIRERMASYTDDELRDFHKRMYLSDDRGNIAFLQDVYAEMKRRGIDL